MAEFKQYNLPEEIEDTPNNIVYQGDASIVKEGSLESPNYVPGQQGWALFSDGSADLRDLNADSLRGGLSLNDFDNSDGNSGFIFGLDETDSNKPKAYIGTPTSFIKFDPDNGVVISAPLNVDIQFIAGESLQLVPTTNLVSFWPFEETSGTRADSHGPNNLTDNNTVGSGTGKVGTAADFERDNTESLSITDAAQVGLALTSDLSIFGWIKTESSIPTDDAFTIASKEGDVGNLGYVFRVADNSGTKRLEFFVSDDGTNSVGGVVNWTPSTGTWYHVGCVYDASAGSVEFYVDGAQQGLTQTGLDNSIFDNTADFIVGDWYRTTPRRLFDGFIDELGVWSRTLTGAEITSLYNSGIGIGYNTFPAVGFGASPDGMMYKVSASNATSAASFMGIALDNTVSMGETVSVRVEGKVPDFVPLTAYQTYYLSNTAGQISTSPGSTSKIIGRSLSTSDLQVKYSLS